MSSTTVTRSSETRSGRSVLEAFSSRRCRVSAGPTTNQASRATTGGSLLPRPVACSRRCSVPAVFRSPPAETCSLAPLSSRGSPPKSSLPTSSTALTRTFARGRPGRKRMDGSSRRCASAFEARRLPRRRDMSLDHRMGMGSREPGPPAVGRGLVR
jgi:hypothetical protein